MMALPLGYRIWVQFNPPTPKAPFSLSRYLAAKTAVRPERLLVKPLSQWTEAERRGAPEIVEWLLAHDRVILPWEWSEAAQTKDAVGYVESWRSLLKELDAEVIRVRRQVAWLMLKARAHAKFNRLLKRDDLSAEVVGALLKREAELMGLRADIDGCLKSLDGLDGSDGGGRKQLSADFSLMAQRCIVACLRVLSAAADVIGSNP